LFFNIRFRAFGGPNRCYRHVFIWALIDDAIGRIRKSGKAAGILTSVEADARHWLELGAQFVAVGADVNILARETEKLSAKFKNAWP
jgi:4-hydroxy-2-oxoheptanedioate aldolase